MKRRVHKLGASRKRRKIIAVLAERFNRLKELSHQLFAASRGTGDPRWHRAAAIDLEASRLWEKIQKDVRKRTKRRKSPFESRSES